MSICMRTRSHTKTLRLFKEQANKQNIQSVITHLSQNPHIFHEYVSEVMDIAHNHTHPCKVTKIPSQIADILKQAQKLQYNINDIDNKLIVIDFILLKHPQSLYHSEIFHLVKTTYLHTAAYLHNPYTKVVILLYLRRILYQLLHITA